MAEEHGMKVIARIHNDFPTKFGIPHQSNRLDALKATIVFEPEYRVPEAFRGLEEYVLRQCERAGRRLYDRRDLVGIHAWECFPRDHRFVRTALDCLLCVLKK